MSDTPKTDAEVRWTCGCDEAFQCVEADFARAQERRIAHLELALHQIKNGCVDEDDKINEWYRSAPQEIRKTCIDALEGNPL